MRGTSVRRRGESTCRRKGHLLVYFVSRYGTKSTAVVGEPDSVLAFQREDLRAARLPNASVRTRSGRSQRLVLRSHCGCSTCRKEEQG